MAFSKTTTPQGRDKSNDVILAVADEQKFAAKAGRSSVSTRFALVRNGKVTGVTLENLKSKTEDRQAKGTTYGTYKPNTRQYSINGTLRQYQAAYGDRQERFGMGAHVAISFDDDVTLRVYLEQLPSLIYDRRVRVSGHAPICAPRMENGQKVAPFMEFTQLPTDLDDIEDIQVPGHGSVTDLLEAEAERRMAAYAENHDGDELDISPIECLQFAIGVNHSPNIDFSTNKDGRLVNPGDRGGYTAEWLLDRAGIVFGVRVDETTTFWFGFTPWFNLAQEALGVALVTPKPVPVPSTGFERRWSRPNVENGARKLAPAAAVMDEDLPF